MAYANIALPDFKPDQSVNSGVLLRAENVYAAMDGYRPIGDIETVSDALAGAFTGGASAISSNGTGYLLAGTASNLYRYSAGAWTSIATGLSAVSRWRFAQFGQYSISVNGSATLEVDLGAATCAPIAGAPTGTSVCVVGDHVVIGQAGGNIDRVQWSAFGNHTGWTPGLNQSGFQPMLTGGSVMGVCGGEYGVIMQRERIVRMTLTGEDTAPFQFDEISSNYGCAAAATIAQAGRTIFFRSDRGFMALDDGQVLKPIGSEKVDRAFDAQVSRDDLENIYTAVDPQNKLVIWGIPGAPGTMWIYNFELDRWTTAKLNFVGVFPGFTTSLGVDDFGLLYGGTDDTTYTTDDPRWSGGNPRLYIVGLDQKIGTLAGDNLEANLELGFTQFSPGRRSRVRGVRLVSDAVSGVTVAMDARQRLGDSATNRSVATMRDSGLLPIRTAGKFIKTSIKIAAGTAWGYVQALDVEFQPGGER